MFNLKEFYQYQRDLKRENNTFRPLVLSPLKPLPVLQSSVLIRGTNFEEGIIFLKASQNNTMVTLTNMRGKVQLIRSCGSLGFQGKKKRSTKFAIESTLLSIVQKIKELRWGKVAFYLNGFAKGRFLVYNIFKKNNIKVVFIKDVTPIPHNGCRLKKLRRG